MRREDQFNIELSHVYKAMIANKHLVDEHGFIALTVLLAYMQSECADGKMFFTALLLIQCLLFNSKPRFVLVVMFNGTWHELTNMQTVGNMLV